MSFLGGLTGAQRKAELLKQDAAAKQERGQSETKSRKQAHEARPSRLRRLLRRRSK